MKGKRNLKLLKALGIAPCGCVQDKRCETHKDPEKFPYFPPDRPMKGKRRKMRRFYAWVSSGAFKEKYQQAGVDFWLYMTRPGGETVVEVEVREVPRRKRAKA